MMYMLVLKHRNHEVSNNVVYVFFLMFKPLEQSIMLYVCWQPSHEDT